MSEVKKGSVNVSIRVEKTIVEEFKEVAADEGRSMANLIKKLMSDYIQDHKDK